MSLTGGAATGVHDAASWPRWARANVGAAMTALAASPRFRAVQGTRARVLAAGLATILLVAAAMTIQGVNNLAHVLHRGHPRWLRVSSLTVGTLILLFAGRALEGGGWRAVAGLAVGARTTLTFSWNLTGASLGARAAGAGVAPAARSPWDRRESVHR